MGLSKSNNYAQFEQQMKNYGYQVLKGRGVSFIDEKKVKVKGSELNYSLQTIERLLERKQLYQSQQSRLNIPPDPHRAREQSSRHETSIGGESNLSKMLKEVLKPQEYREQLDPHLLKKPNQKKRRSQHL